MEDTEESVPLHFEEFNKLQAEWITRAMPWISVTEHLPSIGQRVILFGNGVVQEESYILDAADVSDYHTEYFWSREDLEEGVPVTDDQQWIPWPSMPKAG
jgi:hypothetical protein